MNHERLYVRGFPGTEARPEWHQLVWECDQHCVLSEIAVPLILQKTLDSDVTL